jgi:hypothetical protein
MTLTPDQQFEALKLRYEDHVELLRFMTKLDMEIFGAYITLQLALGSFLARMSTPLHTSAKIGICIIDLTLAFIAVIFLRNNFYRRKEAVATLTNVMSALGYDQPGVFGQAALNPPYRFRPWAPWYFVGVSIAFAGVVLLLFGGL